MGWSGLKGSEDSWEAMEGIVEAALELVKMFMGRWKDMRLIRYYNGKFRGKDA